MLAIRKILSPLIGLQLIGAGICFGSPQDDSAKIEFFENRIRPVLIKSCYGCHSPEAEEIGGNLLLDSRKNILRGGDLGPALIVGKPAESLIISALKHDDLEMPPDGKLPGKVVADFEKWIKDGAFDPRTGGGKIVERKIDLKEGRKFWSFQPIKNPIQSRQPTDSIDFLVLQQLEKNGMTFAPPAKPLDLLERVYFDLIGLPPPPDIQRDFSAGKKSFETVVDELLASNHFGEKMGRHWLDVSRYADSSGGGRVLLFPDAWRYRDYVINSFNNDKPFDQFVREQIAGDLLHAQKKSRRAEELTATGFLMLGAHNYELQDKELLRMEVVDEQINVVGRAFLGMTLSCARCHDHKFDPIPTSDYYALAGIFRSTKSLLPGNVSQFVTTDLPLEERQKFKLEEFNKQKKMTQSLVDSLEARVKKLENNSSSFDAKNLQSFKGHIIDEDQAEQKGKWTHSTSISPYIAKGYHHSPEASARMFFRFNDVATGRYLLRAAYTASSNRTSKARYRVRTSKVDRTFTVDQRKRPPLESHFVKLIELDLKKGDRVEVMLMPGPDGTTIADAIHLQPMNDRENKPKIDKTKLAQIKALKQELKKAKSELAKFKTPPVKLERVMSVREEDQTEDFFVCVRGDVHSLGPQVPRSGLSVVGNLELFEGLEGSGRRELAEWITDAKHPLTARVYANRIWYWVFGQGIVTTPDNFGTAGSRPTNPELLDYLSSSLVESGWSTKKLVREIVLSKTYQQSVTTKNSKDMENQNFGRHPRKRLRAESIRDRILVFAGVLEESNGGPSIKSGTKREFGYKYDSLKRSIYLPVFRNTLNEVFEVFDFPNPNLVSGKRNSSILPTQALFMMNSQFVGKQATNAARRTIRKEFDLFRQQLDYVYRNSVARPPNDAEVKLAKKFFSLSQDADSPAVTDEVRWSRFCRILISSIDFRYLN